MKISLADLEKPQEIPVDTEDQARQPLAYSPLSLSKLKFLAESDKSLYSSTFILRYLFLKIHSFKNYGDPSLAPFVIHFTKFYNEYLKNPSGYVFKESQTDGELMAQILLQSKTHEYLNEDRLQEILESAGLVLATLIQAFFRVKPFLTKIQQVVALSFTSLHCRTSPFFAFVHQEKNHKGQQKFAAAIFQCLPLDPSMQHPELSMAQDSYSVRCSPQVHGVVYQCMSQIEEHLKKSVGKPLMKTIQVKGRSMRNMLFRSQTETLMLDRLILALNEIGHMSFLRSERKINPHLCHNNISKSPFIDLIRMALVKASHHVVNGKLLSGPTNADTVIMENYRHDIYFNDGVILGRLNKTINGLTELMGIEAIESIEIIEDMFGKGRLFKNDQMEKVYRELTKGKEDGFQIWNNYVKKWIHQ